MNGHNVLISFNVFPFIFRYLTELLGERHKLSPFMAVLPHSYRLLNQGQIRLDYISYGYC